MWQILKHKQQWRLARVQRLFASKRSSRRCWQLNTAEHSWQQANKQQLCVVHFSRVIKRSLLTTSNHLLTVVTLCLHCCACNIYKGSSDVSNGNICGCHIHTQPLTPESAENLTLDSGFKRPRFQCSKTTVACGQSSKTGNITSRLQN